MNAKQCASMAAILLIVVQNAAAIEYTIVPDDALIGGYGISGTISTDGSLGQFSDTSPIVDWNLTMLTPGGVDGITSQLLTPSTSTISLGFSGVGFLVLTPTEMLILNSGNSNTTNLFVNPISNELLSFEGPDSDLPNGFVAVSDLNETPGFSSFAIGDAISATFAVVPEPGSLTLVGIGAALLGCWRRWGT